MKKRKAQLSVFYCSESGSKYFLLLRTNEQRGSFWQNITGGVEEGESFLEGAKRELQEETSISDNQIESLHESSLSFDFKNTWGEECHEKCFIVKLKEKTDIKIDPSEHSEFKWVPQQELSRESVKYESNYELLKEGVLL